MNTINYILFALLCLINLFAMYFTVKVLGKPLIYAGGWLQWQNLRIREKNKIVSWLFNKGIIYCWIYKILMYLIMSIPMYFDIPYWTFGVYIIALILWTFTALNNYRIYRRVFK